MECANGRPTMVRYEAPRAGIGGGAGRGRDTRHGKGALVALRAAMTA